MQINVQKLLCLVAWGMFVGCVDLTMGAADALGWGCGSLLFGLFVQFVASQ